MHNSFVVHRAYLSHALVYYYPLCSVGNVPNRQAAFLSISVIMNCICLCFTFPACISVNTLNVFRYYLVITLELRLFHLHWCHESTFCIRYPFIHTIQINQMHSCLPLKVLTHPSLSWSPSFHQRPILLELLTLLNVDLSSLSFISYLDVVIK